MNNLIEKLEKEGFKVQKVTVHNFRSTGNDVAAIIIDTDYEGPYPTSEVYKQHEKIRTICKKDTKRWIVVPHIMRVCVKIFDCNDIQKVAGENDFSCTMLLKAV